MSSKQIKVGQRWRRRNGTEDTIVQSGYTSRLPFVGTSGYTYTEEGTYCVGGDLHQLDLVELIDDVPPAQPASKPLFTVGMEGVTTSDGRKVRILCTDLKKPQPIVAAVETASGGEQIYNHSADGKFQPLGAQSPHDLIPPPPPKQYVWMNVYKRASGGLESGGVIYKSKDAADDGSPPSRLDRVGCIKVPLEERWDE